MEWWDGLFRRDTEYSAATYTNFATLLAAAANRPAANEIRLLARNREQQNYWATGAYFAAGWLYVQEFTVGYGIGVYALRIVIWIGLMTTIGWIILWKFVPETRHEQRGGWWCFFAALSKILPVVVLNPSFERFFADASRFSGAPVGPHMRRWQHNLFYVFSLLGWIFALILVGALTDNLLGK